MVIIFWWVSLLISCTNPAMTPMGCEFPEGDVLYSQNLDTANYYFPSFNPADPNEFCYAKEYMVNQTTIGYSICKYNLQTQTGDTIRNWNGPTNYIDPTLSWGSSGYILTAGGGERIYRIHPVTGEIVWLSNNLPTVYWPIWSYDGSKIIYTNASSIGNHRIEWMDLNGNVLDSIHQNFYWNYMYYGTSLSNGHFLAFFPNLDLYEYDENLDSVAHYSINTNWGPCGSFDFNCHDVRGIAHVGTTSKIVFSTATAIYTTDLSTGITTTIATTCETNPYYGDFSVSGDGQKLIYTKLHLQKTGTINYLIRRKIHVMNMDGTGDQIIQLP